MDAAPRTVLEIRRGIEAGRHTGAQVYASVLGPGHRRTVLDLALGQARPGVPMRTSTVVEWASATKPVTCVALMRLVDAGLLGLDDPVHKYLPEFAARGKEHVTVRHLLTHTAGLTSTVTGVVAPERMVADICASPLAPGWRPGTRSAYNSVAMWIVAALVSRLSGRRFGEFVRTEVFGPAGIEEAWIGMPEEEYDARRDELAVIAGFTRSGTRDWVTWERPTGGGHGPIRELGRFYEAFLDGRLCSEAAVAEMTRPQVSGAYDEYLLATVDRGLGFLLRTSYAGHTYGPHASPDTYGHGGRSWCVGLADPAHGLAAAVYWNGTADTDLGALRQPATLAALYADLGLVT
ncbi:serine hydrolase domain-containing protein [Actinopolymorpha singaporensis]|uniref:CubicO group peptidase, beta-lactamase class C family n=1 Tax=Actinopolymorpha singaporensis TaxID=117157 RepID=A0A1H1N347_9ACTN|nr:serine hydrolase domain-containing protein [Actinopolymorpha singaporensis]SDR93320.1 CubicO group peptidase, beta-lactamase class C family [Actinopolymorpha singaporensis]